MKRLALVLAIVLTACSVEPTRQAADLVVRNAAVYTGDPSQPWAQAMAVVGTDIAFVGNAQAVADFVGEATRVVDFDGAMVMPGLTDAHVHPVRGALGKLFQCQFPFTATPSDVRERVQECVENAGEREWVVGGQWDSGFFERFNIESPRRFLDEVSKGKRIVLRDDSLHNVWVNTAVLAIAGLTSESDDPTGGRIVREQDGQPNGVLLETAAKMINSLVPEYSLDERVAAVEEWSRIANGFGITAAKAASTYDSESEALKVADEAGKLSVHMAVSLRQIDGSRTETLDYDEIVTRRDRYASTHVDTRFVKLFLDGVPTPARTAAMLEPYVDAPDYPPGFTGGALLISPAALKRDLVALDRLGFTVKMHAAGDRSVREALNAIAAARKENGNSGLRHELAHAGYVAVPDIARFRELDAVADLSPILWHPSPIIRAVISAVGDDRGNRYWPVRDYLDAAAGVAAGSDWPAAVPSANPWPGIEALVTRRHPNDAAPGALWPEQAISLEEAIAIYTREGARAMRKIDRIGSLEVGKSADFIVLDRNIFGVPIESVGDTVVRATYFEGRRVHGDN